MIKKVPVFGVLFYVQQKQDFSVFLHDLKF